MSNPNHLKARLRAGQPALGAWLSGGSATMAEVMAQAGFDFLIIDQEHGQGTMADAIAMMRAIKQFAVDVVVRVPALDPVYLKKILDAGAPGVMVPMVENAREAALVVEACRYPPLGRRGYAAGAVRAGNYGTARGAGYYARAHEELLICVQIESVAAAAHAAEIAAVDGIDVVFIGVNDLAGSLGLLERLDDPRVLEVVGQIERDVKAVGKAMLGTVPGGGRTWRDLMAAGHLMVPATGDIVLLRQGALDFVADRTTNPPSGY